MTCFDYRKDDHLEYFDLEELTQQSHSEVTVTRKRQLSSASSPPLTPRLTVSGSLSRIPRFTSAAPSSAYQQLSRRQISYFSIRESAPRQQMTPAGIRQSTYRQQMTPDGIRQSTPSQQTVPSSVISLIPRALAAPSNIPRPTLPKSARTVTSSARSKRQKLQIQSAEAQSGDSSADIPPNDRQRSGFSVASGIQMVGILLYFQQCTILILVCCQIYVIECFSCHCKSGSFVVVMMCVCARVCVCVCVCIHMSL